MTVSVASQSLSLPSSSRSNSGSSFFSSFSSFSFLSSESDSSSYSFLLAQIILFSAIASFLFLKMEKSSKTILALSSSVVAAIQSAQLVKEAYSIVKVLLSVVSSPCSPLLISFGWTGVD